MTFWLSALAVFLLLILSGFFSGSETALTAASKARMFSLSRKGHARAKVVKKLRDQKDRMIGALLLGNNLVNILASALATSVLIKMFGDTGVVYATIGMTLLVLIFAEVLPKTYAMNNADRVALAIAPIISALVFVFAPITDTITKIVCLTLKMFGVDMNSDDDETEEELRGAIELHTGEEEDEAQESRAMLRSILDLNNVEVDEIMVHRRNVMTIDVDLSPEEIVQEVLNSPYTRMPLWKENTDNVVGILHTKLLLRELQKHAGDPTKLDIPSILLEPWFIPETANLYDQLQEFRRRREHFSLVVDEYGSLMGIVTLEDILEEIVGEIDDEHDVVVTGVKPQADGSFLIDGDVTIRDLNREFDWGLPDDSDYATLAGLILFETRSIPNLGQSFRFFGFRFEIIRKQHNQLSLFRVIPPALKKEA